MAVVVHGPYFESTADLEGIVVKPTPANPTEDESDTVRGPSAVELDSPRPTSGPFEATGMHGNDPEIAASETHVIVTTNGRIGFFTKGGTPLRTDHFGKPLPNPIDVFSFFHHVWNGKRNASNIDFGLKLPHGLTCDVTDTEPDGELPDACVDSVYDTRVVFDEFRKRFWIVASARNDSDKNFRKLDSPARYGRRSYILVAVSRTQDPRDGWSEWWWDAVPGQAACQPTPLVPPLPCPGTDYVLGDAADYPSVGVSADFFVQTIGVAGSAQLWVGNANALAAGRCPHACVVRYAHFTSIKHVEPAVSHDPIPGGWTVLADHDGGTLHLFGLRRSEGAFPPLHETDVSVLDGDSVVDGPQFLHGAISFTNLVKGALRAATDGPELVATWQDCEPHASGGCSTAVRVVRVDAGSALNGSDVKPTIDTLIGGHDAVGVTFDGDPGVDVDADGNIVVSFLRTAPRLNFFPQARYAVIRPSDRHTENSQLLHAGSAEFGPPSVGVVKGSNLDTGGAAVDPSFGHEGVWVLHAFATPKSGSSPPAGQWAYAFAKILGARHADPRVDGGKLIKTTPQRPHRGDILTVSVPVANDGDGRSHPIMVSAFLVDPKRNLKFRLGADRPFFLDPARSTTVTIRGAVPSSLAPGEYAVRIEIAPQQDEYSTANNTAEAGVTIG